MTKKEEDVVAAVVKKLIDNGAIDEIVVATLESALETVFWDLEALSQKRYLQAHQWQDLADGVEFSHAAITVLRFFSMNGYEAEYERALEYSMLLEKF